MRGLSLPSISAGEQRHPFAGRCLLKSGVERGKRQALPLRQLQVRGIVHRQPMSPGKPQHRAFLRGAVYPDSKPRKVHQESSGVGFRNPAPAFVHYQDVSHLELPQAGCHRFFGTHLLKGQSGIRMVFIRKGPARRDGRIENEGHQDLRPSSRADSSSPKAILLVRLRNSWISARAWSICS